jgi:hypothetical protein
MSEEKKKENTKKIVVDSKISDEQPVKENLQMARCYISLAKMKIKILILFLILMS